MIRVKTNRVESDPRKRAVVYVRVSDPKQVDGTSLDFQVEQIQGYCSAHDIEVVSVFVEKGESAKTALRTEFIHALEYCRKHQNELTSFVVYRVDRFARNVADHFEVRKRLASWGITLVSVTEAIGDAPSERFVEAILAATSEFDNVVRGVRCTDGMKARIEEGIWPFRPPIGYACQHYRKRGQKKNAPDPKDEALAPIIGRALKAFASGVHSQTDIARLLDQWGLAALRGRPTNLKFTNRLLGHDVPFYAGFLRNPWTGKLVRGRHEPLISENEMRCIQAVRSGKGLVKPRERQNVGFPLRRFVRCPACSTPLTGSISRGRSGVYPYYHCYEKTCPKYGKVVPKMTLETKFTELLARLTPHPRLFALVEAEIKREWADRGGTAEARRATLGAKLKTLGERRTRMFAAFEMGAYELEELEKRKTDLDAEAALLKREIDELPEEKMDVAGVIAAAFQLLRDLPRAFATMDARQWTRFQRILFPKGIFFDRDSGFGTAEVGLIYAISDMKSGGDSAVVDFLRVHCNEILHELLVIAENLQENGAEITETEIRGKTK
ncbi:MAG: recombinase family protein [Thermoanaerobaculia bacterium]|nr:recombinase family protein [Myxococcota bacterium]MCK6682667.1 recombinase family protein [Thermoanaerobaculia bacterium]